MSLKNSNDTIGNRTRDLPACSAVLQPSAPPRAPFQPKYFILTWRWWVLNRVWFGFLQGLSWLALAPSHLTTEHDGFPWHMSSVTVSSSNTFGRILIQKNQHFLGYSKFSHYVLETEVSLPRSQQPATFFYPEPGQSNPRLFSHLTENKLFPYLYNAVEFFSVVFFSGMHIGLYWIIYK